MNKLYYRITDLSGNFIEFLTEDGLYDLDINSYKAELISNDELYWCKMLVKDLPFRQRLKLLFGVTP